MFNPLPIKNGCRIDDVLLAFTNIRKVLYVLQFGNKWAPSSNYKVCFYAWFGPVKE